MFKGYSQCTRLPLIAMFGRKKQCEIDPSETLGSSFSFPTNLHADCAEEDTKINPIIQKLDVRIDYASFANSWLQTGCSSTCKLGEQTEIRWIKQTGRVERRTLAKLQYCKPLKFGRTTDEMLKIDGWLAGYSAGWNSVGWNYTEEFGSTLTSISDWPMTGTSSDFLEV